MKTQGVLVAGIKISGPARRATNDGHSMSNSGCTQLHRKPTLAVFPGMPLAGTGVVILSLAISDQESILRKSSYTSPAATLGDGLLRSEQEAEYARQT